MYPNKTFSKIKKAGIIISLCFGVILVSSVDAQAQHYEKYRVKDHYGDRYGAETARIAYNYGYEDGFEDGRDAGRERDTYNPQNSGDYKKAANGYESRFGSKSVYKRAYRAAYLKGYRAGYNRYVSPRYYRY